MNHETVLPILERAAALGAEAICRGVGDGKKVEINRKADQTLVMSLDIASQEAMREAMSDVGVVVSEEDPDSHQLISSHASYFLIDPLDGTSSCYRCLRAHGGFVPGNVGFGPIAGFVEKGRVVAAAFVNVAERILFSAYRGRGATMVKLDEQWKSPLNQERRIIKAARMDKLSDAAATVYSGRLGEVEFVQYLNANKIIDTFYRFGSFANDCTRLARGFEQLQIHFSPRAWDLPAALIAAEAGCSVIMDPFEGALNLSDWPITMTNPLIVVAPGLEGQIRKVASDYVRNYKTLGQDYSRTTKKI
jgi:fructose-1,6-bisphosphatase/inositol monophosphatase family enzyme